MRKLILSDITSLIRMPLKSGTLQFLQDAYAEILFAMLRMEIGDVYDQTKAYVLYGCRSSVSGGNTLFTEGAILYGGEVYLAPAQSIVTPGGGNVIICNILISQYTGNGTNADQVTFTDSTPRNVHNIRTVQYVSGSTGTGTIADYSALIRLDKWVTGTNPTATTNNAPVGTFTIGGGDIVYNKFELKGGTLHWQLRLQNITIAGAPTKVFLTKPTSLYQGYSNQAAKFLGVYNNAEALLIELSGPTAPGQITISRLSGAAFTNGTNDQNFDIAIVAEVTF